jgi:hypothetical protein
MKKFCQKILDMIVLHKYALITMTVVALIYGMPQVIARYSLPNTYAGIPYLVNDSEGEYVSRIREILDGHYTVSSPAFYEYKNSVSLIPPTSEFFFYVLPKIVTGLSLNSIIFLSRFVLPALVFIFVYSLLLSISLRSRYAHITAIAGGLFVILGAGIADYHSFFSYLIHGGRETYFLWQSRLVNPVTGTLTLFVILNLMWWIMKKQTSWFVSIGAGVVLAIMSGYVFSFALALTIAILLTLFFIWKKDWQKVLKMASIPILALAFNALYIVKALRTLSHSTNTSDPLRSGMFLTHVPTLNIISVAVLLVVTALFTFLYVKSHRIEKEDETWWVFVFAISLSCVIAYIQQIVTGITVWPQHFSQYTVILALVVFIILLQNFIGPRWHKLRIVGITFFIIISSVFALRMLLSIPSTILQFADQQSFAPVFEWLNNNAEKDCVVYVSSDYGNEINRFIPAFTSCNVYHSFYNYNGVPPERIMDNFIVNLRLRGIKTAEISRHWDENWFWVHAYFFRDWGDMFCCSDRWLVKIKNPEEIAGYFDSVEKDVEEKYSQSLKTDLKTELAKYKIDYFVVDTEKQPQVNEKNFTFLKPEKRYGRFMIYSFNK